MSDQCVTVPVLFRSFHALDTAMKAEIARGNDVVAARLEVLRVSPYLVLLMRWGEACAYAKKNKLPWPLGGTQGVAVKSRNADVTRPLGTPALATEKGWLTAHESSTLACTMS